MHGTPVREKIIDYISPITNVHQNEYALLFGSRHAQAELARHTYGLFKAGFFERLIISGGPTQKRSRSEAEELADRLGAAGMHENRLLLESKSLNTKENVSFSRRLLHRQNISSILLIGKIYAKRRYVMTIKKQWPEILQVSCSTINYFKTSRERWWDDLSLRQRILGEHRKITQYTEGGDIEEIGIQEKDFVLR